MGKFVVLALTRENEQNELTKRYRCRYLVDRQKEFSFCKKTNTYNSYNCTRKQRLVDFSKVLLVSGTDEGFEVRLGVVEVDGQGSDVGDVGGRGGVGDVDAGSDAAVEAGVAAAQPVLLAVADILRLKIKSVKLIA